MIKNNHIIMVKITEYCQSRQRVQGLFQTEANTLYITQVKSQYSHTYFKDHISVSLATHLVCLVYLHAIKFLLDLLLFLYYYIPIKFTLSNSSNAAWLLTVHF